VVKHCPWQCAKIAENLTNMKMINQQIKGKAPNNSPFAFRTLHMTTTNITDNYSVFFTQFSSTRPSGGASGTAKAINTRQSLQE
jgi:hypothetical protein